MKERSVVIGAGVMGRGIAYVSAIGGYQVSLVDVSEEVLQNAEREVHSNFEKGIQRGKLRREDAEQAMQRMKFNTDFTEVAKEADLIIEAVPEKRELKKSIFETLDKFASDKCILATNTSTMSPTEIGSFTSRPSSVIAMHFFNPVHKMPLVEIIRGMETSDETVQYVESAANKMGKQTVIVNEFPGFVTSRISCLVGNEAFHMLQEGVATAEDIDKAVKLGLNFPMGPLELADLVGLDARLNNLRYLHGQLGEKYRPAPLLEKYVKAGRLGRKSGIGVYDYSKKESE
ncbi:3-hydroxyacyl-CoA dehydrogenase [Oceanobacillus salinisoli]|uniref:3-hydroxyacyl-CoA dehydrogenase n=1 Tax=Oceanobacillus salinisoli TaxID=2678611 RepID=UPI0012E0DC8E|nr:3-hydroxyacyl-CoA dehydrogenase [Oceanobacillus salinisoli]